MMRNSLLTTLSVSLCLVGVANADESIYIGPDAAGDAPYIVDTIGEQETTFRAHGGPSTGAKPSRWRAKLSFFVHYKDAADDDVVMIQVMKGKKKLGKPVPCRPDQLFKDDALIFFDCMAPEDADHDASFSGPGAHTISLTYRRVIEGKEFKDFARLSVMVEELKQGASNDPSLSWGESHDMKLAVTTLEEKTNNAGSRRNAEVDNALGAARREGIPYMLVETWFKREKRVEATKISCLFDGKKIAEAQSTSNKKYSSWSYVKKGKPDRNDQSWTQAKFFLYSLHPRPDAKGQKGSWAVPQHWMNEHPGDYKCVVTGDGEILKEIFFKVGEDGEIVKPECQLKSMNSLRTVTLVESKDKKLSTVKHDAKAGKKSGFEGRVTWSRGCPLAN